jgi:exodeoxyribonuclease VIII
MKYGIFDGIPNYEYHNELQAISKSDLDLIDKAPFIYHQKLMGEYSVNETDAMNFGSLVHTAILEPELLSGYVSDANFLEAGGRTTKGYKSALEMFKALNPNTTVIKKEDFETLENIKKEVESNKLIQSLLSDGKAEQTVLWNEQGLDFKCRPDYMREWEGKTLAIDLKTTKSCKDFERAIANFRYHVQAAHYTTGLINILKKPVLFIFIVLEKEYPFGSRIIALDDMTLELGVKVRQANIDTLKKCMAEGFYPKYEKEKEPQIEIVNVPNWAFYNYEFERR